MVITHPIEMGDGHLHLSERPRLGTDLIWEELEQHRGIADLGRVVLRLTQRLHMTIQIYLQWRAALVSGGTSGIGLGIRA